MRPKVFRMFVAVALALALPAALTAQQSGDDDAMLRAVLPAAVRFAPVSGDPPVVRGYAPDPATGEEVLVGYVFLTSDLPPEEMGYSGPIQVMVGMDVTGQLTGARVIDYYESLRSSRGDFLRRRGFQEQFAGKYFTDPFRVRRDIDGISGATITVAAMSRGIRNAARRVAAAYLAEKGKVGPDDIERLAWPELMERGLGDRIQAVDDGVLQIEVSLVALRDDAMGRTLMGGEPFGRALERLGERATGRRLWLVGVDGGLEALFRATALFILRGNDTLRFTMPDLVMMGEPRAGKLDGQLRNAGLLLVDSVVDPARSFTWLLDFGGGLGPFTTVHPGEAVAVVTPPPANPAPLPSPPSPVPTAVTATAGSVTVAIPPPVMKPDIPPSSVPISIISYEEESVLLQTLDRTSWLRFGLLAALLVLALVAFLAKRPALRWATLVATVALLGFGGVGFLSVSHITSAIEVGPGVFLEDLPLLLFVGIVAITTLLWGRVFCGYLCPFGALQDLLERVVPRRFKRELPRPLHERALWLKYGVLALVVVPAVIGSQVTLFQYVEPFGTVFFLSSSVVLWTIALGLLAASAVVPRFYCRYVCPLGASLAVASVLSPFRIRRVEQCTVCKVCEQDCPTGAIAGPAIDFKECVRCNVCEVNLKRQVGTCGHDMADVRARLVQIGPRTRPELARGR